MSKFTIALLTAFLLTFNLKAQVFKVMTYNLMFYKVSDSDAPCTQGIPPSIKDLNFKTVFKAIDPHILCVNEIVTFPDNSAARSVLTNVINTDGENRFTSAGFSNNGSSSIGNMLFYDSTLFALKSQDFIANTLNNQNIVRVIDFYRLYYKDPGLKLGADTTFMTVVVGHLKAGNSSSDRTDRERAILATMDYLTNNVPDDNVLLCGDMNIYTSSELAYQNMVNYSVASENFVDPLATGSWNNNGNFAPLHTQSTHQSSSGCFAGGGLDDRFDFILFSQAINSGSDNIKYKLNTMRAIGNDGSHFNQSVNSGTNGMVSKAVADALYAFSDHLPLVAEFEVTPSGIGLDEAILSDLLLINNPFDNELVISKKRASGTAWDIFVYDLNGSLLSQEVFAGSEEELRMNTSRWQQGMYIIRLSDRKGQVFTEKLIK